MMIFPILKQRIIPKPAKDILVFRHFFIGKLGYFRGDYIALQESISILIIHSH